MLFRKSTLALTASLFALAACETAPQGDGSATGTGVDGYNNADSMSPYESSVAPGTLQDFISNVGDRVFFGYDSAVINAEAQSTLERQASWLMQNPGVTVTIEGHCDERGTREYNLALGERRADATRNYLISLGVKPSRISTISYGKERPDVIGSSDSAWAKNRRSVTILN